MEIVGESTLAQIFEVGRDGEILVAGDGRVRLANEAAHRILGWEPGTLIERSLSDVFPTRFHQGDAATTSAVLGPGHGSQSREELVAHRRDGTDVRVEITARSVGAVSEGLRYFVIRDVSARHEAAERLRASEETFRMLVEGVRDYAIIRLDRHGHVCTWNTGAQRMKGYTADEIIGQSFVRFYPVQEVIAGTPSRLLRQAAEYGVATDEGLRVRKDGSQFWAHVVITALRDGSGELLGFAKITRDVSDQKRAQQAVTTLSDASRLLAESLDPEQILFTVTHVTVPTFADAVLVHRRDRRGEPRLDLFHASDPAMIAAIRQLHAREGFPIAAPSRRVLQTGRAELRGKLDADWLASQQVDPRVAALARAYGITSTIHVPIVLEGRAIAVVVFATARSRSYDEHDLVFAEELARRASTAMHNAELYRKLRIERERAEQEVVLRERLVAIVGHDLRTPLSAIAMAAKLLATHPLATHDAQLVERIQRSVKRMTRMIREILDFARIRSGQSFEIDLAPADLRHVCEVVVDELRMSRGDQEITLAAEGRVDALVDAERIGQVVSNLIGNAIQHGAGGPIEVTVRAAEPDAVAIDVHNAGPPIPKAAQGTIFEPFRRETAAGDRRSSLGLGLFIASEIVRAHGGTIHVRSPHRKGTTFTVTLPRAPAPAPVDRDTTA